MIGGMFGSLFGLLGRGPGGPGVMGGGMGSGGAGSPILGKLANSSPSPLGNGPTVKELGQAVAGNMVQGAAGASGAAGNAAGQAVQAIPQGRPTMMQRAQNWMGQSVGNNGMTRADMLYAIGAGIKDLDGGNDFQAAQAMFADRAQQRKAEGERKLRADALAAAMGEKGFDGNAYLSTLGTLASMDDLVQVERLRDVNQPQYVNTANGLFEIMRGKSPSLVQGSAPPMDAPSGFTWANGQLVPIPGGPADPEYISRVTGERRDAVVSRPMPGRPRTGGGGGAPWARNWGN